MINRAIELPETRLIDLNTGTEYTINRWRPYIQTRRLIEIESELFPCLDFAEKPQPHRAVPVKKFIAIKDMLDVQERDGNWNYSEHMYGMYVALELAWATLNGYEPDPKPKPEKWLADRANTPDIYPTKSILELGNAIKTRRTEMFKIGITPTNVIIGKKQQDETSFKEGETMMGMTVIHSDQADEISLAYIETCPQEEKGE